MIEFTLHSESAELPKVRQQIRRWAADHNWPDAQTDEIALAVDEALTNIIRHGYCGEPDEEIQLAIREIAGPTQPEDQIEIVIRDFCPDVDLDAICGRELNDVRPGGLGVHLIRAMMESVDYSHAAGGGVLLTMRKSKSHRANTEKTKGDTA